MEFIRKILGNTLFAALLMAFSATALAGADQFKGEFWEVVQCPTDDGLSEEIYLGGTYRILSHFIEAGAHTTSTFQVFWEAVGHGVYSDNQYVLHGKWMEVVQQNPPYIFLWNDHFRLIGKGNAGNYELHWKVQMIVNANGDLVVDFNDETHCETLDAG